MADLEQGLRQLGAQLYVPPTPDIREGVRARLDDLGAPTLASSSYRPGLKLVGSVTALVALIALAFTVSPQVRATAGDLFGFAGVEVQWGDVPSSAAPSAPVASPTLPSSSSVDRVARAQQEVAFPIGVPSTLGTPERVIVADSGRVVSLLYTRADTPIRLDEFDGTLEPVFVKVVGGEAVHADVDGADGLWLKEPHSVTYVGRDGSVFEESARLAGATLIWQSGVVTYRLEGNLSRAEALAVAESVG